MASRTSIQYRLRGNKLKKEVYTVVEFFPVLLDLRCQHHSQTDGALQNCFVGQLPRLPRPHRTRVICVCLLSVPRVRDETGALVSSFSGIWFFIISFKHDLEKEVSENYNFFYRSVLKNPFLPWVKAVIWNRCQFSTTSEITEKKQYISSGSYEKKIIFKAQNFIFFKGTNKMYYLTDS